MPQEKTEWLTGAQYLETLLEGLINKVADTLEAIVPPNKEVEDSLWDAINLLDEAGGCVQNAIDEWNLHDARY